ncbi:hypothetical protein [Thalassotalea agarivorans]|uniref:Uncharacterized protein n=1 Tax=Thalassotalea agarivorans TaxID=349064 RepID=A0A1I0BZE6_THASX|nr:hypothetical protein [Thalassotalea agarivorans]SET11817.1 hypothetical protein SAMN05660429_01089 [Thalassotalea agarivorans]
MIKYLPLLFCLVACSSNEPQQEAENNNPQHGDIRNGHKPTMEIYYGPSQQWMQVEDFWRTFAQDNYGGYKYTGPLYPPYEQAQEFDLLLLEIPYGACLMQFYHERWRRANDVWRWNEKLNEYGGCAHVFDVEFANEDEVDEDVDDPMDDKQ